MKVSIQRASSRPFLPRHRRFCLVTHALLKPKPEAKATWMQDTEEITVRLMVGKQVTKDRVDLTVHPERVILNVEGESYLSGSLEDVGKVDVDGSFWFMDDSLETEEHKCLTLILAKKTMGFESFDHLLETDVLDPTITERVYMSIEIDGKDAGVLVFGLFGIAAPYSVKNFMPLANGLGTKTERKDLTDGLFKKSIQAKYTEFGIRDKQAEDDPYSKEMLQKEVKGFKHESMGLISVDPDYSLTDFFITFNSVPSLDGKAIVFGKILHGMDLLARIEAEGDEETGEPKSSIVISAIGEAGESEIEAIIKEDKERRILESD